MEPLSAGEIPQAAWLSVRARPAVSKFPRDIRDSDVRHIRTGAVGARELPLVCDFLVPLFLRAQIVRLRGRLPVEKTDAERRQLKTSRRVCMRARVSHSSHERASDRMLLALLIRLIPKFGPTRILDIKAPSSVTEDKFVTSVDAAVARFRRILARSQRRKFPILPTWT